MMSSVILKAHSPGRTGGALLALLLMAGPGALQPARADLGAINLYMRANLVSNACSVSVDSVDKTVNLGVWSAKQFIETPAPVPLKRFTINLEDCGPGASGIKFRWDGTPHASNSELYALTGDSTARNVGVELQDWNYHRIPPAFITPAWGVTGNQARVSVPFYARYVRAGGTVTAGTANAVVTFTLEYL